MTAGSWPSWKATQNRWIMRTKIIWHRSKFKTFCFGGSGEPPRLQDTDKPGLVSDNGVWGIRSHFGWSVTHTPTGRRIGSDLRNLRTAKEYADAINALWDGWYTLAEGMVIPPEIAARVRELLTEARK